MLYKVSAMLIIVGILMMTVSAVGLASVFCYRVWTE